MPICFTVEESGVFAIVLEEGAYAFVQLRKEKERKKYGTET
jgi:hypothetical protein